jgi:hypothetical protein
MQLSGCAAYRSNRDGKTPADYARVNGFSEAELPG